MHVSILSFAMLAAGVYFIFTKLYPLRIFSILQRLLMTFKCPYQYLVVQRLLMKLTCPYHQYLVLWSKTVSVFCGIATLAGGFNIST